MQAQAPCNICREGAFWVVNYNCHADALFADATSDAPTERAPVDRKVGANSRGIDEADWRCLAPLDGWEARKRALVVFVLVLIEFVAGHRSGWVPGIVAV